MTQDERKLWVVVGQKAGAVAVIAGLVWLFSAVLLEEALHRVVALILLCGGLLIGVFDPARFPTRWAGSVRLCSHACPGLLAHCSPLLATRQLKAPTRYLDKCSQLY